MKRDVTLFRNEKSSATSRLPRENFQDGFFHRVRRQAFHRALRSLEAGDLRVCGCPDIRVGGAEHQQTLRADRSGDVRDAAVVSDEKAAAFDERGKMIERKIL